MEWIIAKWREAAVIGAFAAVCFTFYGIQADASDAKEKVDKFEETFENIAQIADDLQDPSMWMRNYLINHNIDTAIAKQWSRYTRDPLLDSLGQPMPGLYFLNRKLLPELGVLMVVRDSEFKVLDTLWDFSKRSAQ